jgi:pilus assembly protein Flp/PilA
VKSFAADTGAATAIEYALIASLIAMLIITSLTSMGTKLSSFFTSVSTGLR